MQVQQNIKAVLLGPREAYTKLKVWQTYGRESTQKKAFLLDQNGQPVLDSVGQKKTVPGPDLGRLIGESNFLFL